MGTEHMDSIIGDRESPGYALVWMEVASCGVVLGVGEKEEMERLCRLGLSPWHVNHLILSTGGLFLKPGSVPSDSDPRRIPDEHAGHRDEYTAGASGILVVGMQTDGPAGAAFMAGVNARWGDPGFGRVLSVPGDLGSYVDGYMHAVDGHDCIEYPKDMPMAYAMGLEDGEFLCGFCGRRGTLRQVGGVERARRPVEGDFDVCRHPPCFMTHRNSQRILNSVLPSGAPVGVPDDPGRDERYFDGDGDGDGDGDFDGDFDGDGEAFEVDLFNDDRNERYHAILPDMRMRLGVNTPPNLVILCGLADRLKELTGIEVEPPIPWESGQLRALRIARASGLLAPIPGTVLSVHAGGLVGALYGRWAMGTVIAGLAARLLSVVDGGHDDAMARQVIEDATDFSGVVGVCMGHLVAVGGEPAGLDYDAHLSALVAGVIASHVVRTRIISLFGMWVPDGRVMVDSDTLAALVEFMTTLTDTFRADVAAHVRPDAPRGVLMNILMGALNFWCREAWDFPGGAGR